MEEKIKRLKAIDHEIRLLDHVNALLGWDQNTYMPEAAVTERAEQLSLIQGLVHKRISSDEIGKLLEEVGASEEQPQGDPGLSEAEQAFVRVLFREYNRNAKLPNDLVRKIAEKTTLAHNAWVKARKKSDFSKFTPNLKEIVDLLLEVSDRLGFSDHPYDPLLDEYEPWMKTAKIKEVFSRLREELVPLTEKIKAAEAPDDSVLHGNFPVDAQERFGLMVLEKMGYDFSRGRLDRTVHPFTTGLGRDDVRVTTRYSEDFFNPGLFSIIHEGGHALYELGFPKEIAGTVLANGTSLGIHESQSRLWENMIGRSMPFWTYFFPLLKEYFPGKFENSSVKDFYRAINKVEASHIRVEADEVTYNLHIILRFELETRLIKGELSVDDLPEAWRVEAKDLLGIVPETDAEGVLQDIHWSMGAIGYFPTYCLGNLYAAQILYAIKREVPDLDKLLTDGSLTVVLNWLRKNIHSHGSALTASELCKKISGEELNADYFTNYLNQKYSEIYDL